MVIAPPLVAAASLLAAGVRHSGRLADLSQRPLRHDDRLSRCLQNAAAAGRDDGRDFKSADGADFWVAASYNALDFNVAKYHDFIVKNLDLGSVVTYQARGDNWFVISGTKGAKIFYEKHLLSHGAQMTEDFRYVAIRRR